MIIINGIFTVMTKEQKHLRNLHIMIILLRQIHPPTPPPTSRKTATA